MVASGQALLLICVFGIYFEGHRVGKLCPIVPLPKCGLIRALFNMRMLEQRTVCSLNKILNTFQPCFNHFHKLLNDSEAALNILLNYHVLFVEKRLL